MRPPLRIVNPPVRPGPFRRAYAKVAASHFATTLSRLISWRVDPVLLRLTGGRFATTLVFKAAILETRGARSGHLRRNALIYFHDGDRVIVTASNAGAAHNPDWYANIRANPDVSFVGRRMHAREVEDLVDKQRLELLGDRTFPAFATYRSRAAAAGREVPVVQLTAVE